MNSFFVLRPRNSKTYACLAPYCKSNAAPTYRNKVCAKHKDLDPDEIQRLLLLRDKKKMKARGQ